jgi:amino acid transporter
MTYLTDSTPLLVLDGASITHDAKDTRYGTGTTINSSSLYNNTNNHGDKKTHDHAVNQGGDFSMHATTMMTTHLEISPNPMTEPSKHHFSSASLGTLPLTVIIFYTVSGGPFGIEEAVRSAGAFYSILGFALMPFVFSIPESLMTAELGSAYPEASGGVAWVEEAFGSSAGWMAGYLGWVAGATDSKLILFCPNAPCIILRKHVEKYFKLKLTDLFFITDGIYPVLFLDYVLQIWSSQAGNISPTIRFLLLASTCTILAYINFLGLKVVANMSIVICILSMSPFIIMTLLGIFQVDPQRWLVMPEKVSVGPFWDDEVQGGGGWTDMAYTGILWRPFLNSLFWNLNSFDSAASFAGDVQDPGRTFPRAMFWSILMAVAANLIPVLICIGATDSKQHDWVDGYLATAASKIGGRWLGAWVVFAAGVSNLAQFQAELSGDAFALMGMADRGFVPKIFGKRSEHGTPTYSILLGLAVIIVMGTSNLDTLIEMLNFNYALKLIMEYCAFVKLRISKPEGMLQRRFSDGVNLRFWGPLIRSFVIACHFSAKTVPHSPGNVWLRLVLHSSPYCNAHNHGAC